jgi:hypothetical protein
VKNRKFFYYPEASVFQIVVHRFSLRLRSLVKMAIIFYKFSRQIKTTKGLRGSKKGEKVFIFANGPSVNNLDPNKINSCEYDVFCVNGFLFSEFSNYVTPSHYVLSDPSYFNGAKGNDSQRDIQKNNRLVDDFQKNKITLFVPFEYLEFCEYNDKYGFCDIEAMYSNNTCDITAPRGYRSMTAYKAISIASYLGYEAIYICGFDNSYFKYLEVDEANQVSYVIPHLVGGEAERVYISSVPGCGETVGEYMYIDHHLFDDLEKFNGANIINLDKESLVTAFSKKHNLDIYRASDKL